VKKQDDRRRPIGRIIVRHKNGVFDRLAVTALQRFLEETRFRGADIPDCAQSENAADNSNESH
jgi:hypothetical protein